jgi:hypothetical protein
MSSIDALAEAIKLFEGGVVIVSHDFREWTRRGGCLARAAPRLYGWLTLMCRTHLASRRGSVGGQGQEGHEPDQV